MRKSLFAALVAVFSFLLPAMALAQGGIQQLGGPVVPGHPATFVRNGYVADEGPPGCVYTALPTTGAPYSSLCLTISPSTGGTLTLNSNPLSSPLGLSIVINGVSYPLPASLLPINVPYLAATTFGVVADGAISNTGVVSGTSNDAALKNALAACTAAGTDLWVPAGLILLSGAGGVSSLMQNCHMMGVGGPAGGTTPASLGTTFLLTSTSVPPFIVNSNWRISNVNFYWPGQTTGTVSFPPLFSDNSPAGGVNDFSLDHVTIVNAYDGFVSSIGVGWGNGKISDSSIYAVHDALRVNVLSDAFFISNTLFDPGPWINMCNGNCFTQINAAAHINAIFHASGPNGNFGGLTVSNSGAFDWRYAILVDAGGAFNGNLNMGFDGVLTLVDSSSGGDYAAQSVLNGESLGCYQQVYGGSQQGGAPCFNLGATGGLTLTGFRMNGAQGSAAVTAGANVDLNGVHFDAIDKQNSGSDHYAVQVTAGSPSVNVRNSIFGGMNGDIHAHGITVQSGAVPILAIQNNSFSFFNDDVAFSTAGTAIISGNIGGSTTGSQSLIITGTVPIVYSNNSWDKPPESAVSGCGGSGATISGGLNGFIMVGSTTTSTCSMTLPFTIAGAGGGPCQFVSGNGQVPSAAPSGAPQTWAMTFANPVTNQNIYFQCTAQQ